MGSHNLQSASTYLNNLLLARGLLQDGRQVDFTFSKNNSEETNTTKSQIINLVHDLVLRRDRDAEHREQLASAIRTSRADEVQRIQDIQKLKDENVDLSRALTTAEMQTRNLKAAVRKAEAQAKELKEQMLKMKSMLDQVRAKCISDVRKRDVELEKLKGHLSGLQRGKREASGMKVNVINLQTNLSSNNRNGGQDINSADWSLEKETNDFLAALVNETSSENVALRTIVENATQTLTDLTDFEQSTQDDSAETIDGIGIPGQYRKSRKEMDSAQEALISCESLAARLNAILEHCKSILKDPSFVPIEEVQVREEEIVKLRIGWEKMANKWKEAVTMMDSWRRRVLEGDEAVDVNELSSLTFGRSMAIMPNGDPVFNEEEDNSSFFNDDQPMQEETDVREDNAVDGEVDQAMQSNIGEDEESELDLPPPSAKRLASSPARRGIQLPQPLKVLKEGTGSNKRGRDVAKRQSSKTSSADSGIGSLDGSVDENDTVQYGMSSRKHRRADDENAELTMEQKLAEIEVQAREAERLRLEHRGSKRKLKNTGSRKTNRRRSTLNPDELASLMTAR